MSSEAEYIDSPLSEIAAQQGEDRADSRSRDASPKRPSLRDSSVHESSLSSHAGDTDDELSAASSNDKPPTESEGSSAGDADKLLDDDGLKAICDRGLANFKSLLTKRQAECEREYEFYQIDDDIRADFFHFVLENLVNLDKVGKSESLEDGEVSE